MEKRKIIKYFLEDDPEDQDFIRTTLDDRGVKDYVLFLSLDAFLKTFTKDVMIACLDYKIKGSEKTGLDVCKEIKKINRDCIVIVLSAYSDNKTTIAWINAGATNWIEKGEPGYLDTMVEYIHEAEERACEILENRENTLRFLNGLESLKTSNE